MFLMERLKLWALTAMAVLFVLLGAYVMGGRASRKAADKKRQYEDALHAAAGAKGVHDAEIETNRLAGGDAANQLRRDWMRGDRRNQD